MLLAMRQSQTSLAVVLLFSAVAASAAPRIDNVLIRMVPPGATSLVGAHMDRLLESDLYRKLTAGQKLPQLDIFFRQTGFDPRRDVREILLTTVPQGSVLLARGSFDVKQAPPPAMKTVRRGPYVIHSLDSYGYCILDATLAVAGELPAVEAALDEWISGSHPGAPLLLKSVASIDEYTPLWGVSTGFAKFLGDNLPRAGNGIDFSMIFRGIDTTWFTASANTGFEAAIHCTTATEKDAMNLRDAAKGMIGLGRLSVPEGKPDLLRFWDGLTVEQSGRSFSLHADIGGDLIDQVVQLLTAPGRGGGGRGDRGGSGRGNTGARGQFAPGR